MPTSSLLALLGLAAADALNPFSIAAQAFLLSTDRPAARGLAFILGTAAVYYLGGVLLLGGWMTVLQQFVPRLPPRAPGALEVLAGVLCAGAGAYQWARRAAPAREPTAPSALSLPATLAFGIVSTVSDLPTAIPYFAAASQIAAAASGGARYAWLAVYNVVYVAPLAAMLAGRLLLGARADGVLARVRGSVTWAVATLLPPVLIAAGVFLVADGGGRLLQVAAAPQAAGGWIA